MSSQGLEIKTSVVELYEGIHLAKPLLSVPIDCGLANANFKLALHVKVRHVTFQFFIFCIFLDTW